MTVIDPPPEAMAAGGMEYPTLVTTAGDNVLMRPGIRLPEFVTVHEIGHNWFQGILASNEFREAWLDEGVNEWADGVVMASLYGEKHSASPGAGGRPA
jgi:aminopeptidase N